MYSKERVQEILQEATGEGILLYEDKVAAKPSRSPKSLERIQEEDLIGDGLSFEVAGGMGVRIHRERGLCTRVEMTILCDMPLGMVDIERRANVFKNLMRLWATRIRRRGRY